MPTLATQPLLPHPGRGGFRPGAGRPRNPSPGYVRHETRPVLAARYPVHVTLKLLPHVGNLRRESRIRVLETCFQNGCDRETFRLVHFSIQENHVHMLVEAKNAMSLARGVQGLCIRVAKAFNRLMGAQGRVFKDRYHMHILRTPREARNALSYVLNNGASHTVRRGLRFVGHGPDRASSGRFFDGWAHRNKDVATPESTGAPVRPPRTWLLARGWRKHGLIGLGEVSEGARRAARCSSRSHGDGPARR